MNILEIVIIVVTALLGIMGFRKGFVRKLATMLSLVLSIVLVSLFLPYITDYLKENTPVYDYIVEQCERAVEKYAAELLTGTGSAADSQEELYRSMGREQIADLLEQYGYDSSILDTLSDEQLEQYKEQYIRQYIDQVVGGEQEVSLGKIEQTEIIESLPVPQILKDRLLDYNNDEGYSSLNVTTFQEYVVAFLANVILTVVSYFVAIIVVQFVLWIAITALNIVANIPVIRVINRVAGFGLGLVEALVLIWVFFMILSMFSATEAGLYLMSMVQESEFLGELYDSNVFLAVIMRATSFFA